MGQASGASDSHSRLSYGAMLVFAAAIWGFATVVIKDVVYDIGPLWLVGLRMLSAGLVLALVFYRRLTRAHRRGRLRDHLRAGALIGVFTATAYLLNTYGLVYTTVAKSSFLTSTYVVLTPFLTWMRVKKRPYLRNYAAAVVCVCGIALITLGGEALDGGLLSIGLGDAITLASAVMFAFEVTAGAVLGPGRDIGVITTAQFLVAGVIALVVAVVFEAPPAVEALLAPHALAGLAYLVLAGTCLTMLLQNKGLAHTDASLGSLLLSTESVFGALFAVMFVGEAFTPAMVVGFVLVFASVVVSECAPVSHKGRAER